MHGMPCQSNHRIDRLHVTEQLRQSLRGRTILFQRVCAVQPLSSRVLFERLKPFHLLTMPVRRLNCWARLFFFVCMHS